ncbi:hypothetical protein F5884DRAFT_395769 [Xylogone sp. PMI_703]|nr:hypothetical protein F5884DRAFT_395769 [Xylogone sp. PMI_703]
MDTCARGHPGRTCVWLPPWQPPCPFRVCPLLALTSSQSHGEQSSEEKVIGPFYKGDLKRGRRDHGDRQIVGGGLHGAVTNWYGGKGTSALYRGTYLVHRTTVMTSLLDNHGDTIGAEATRATRSQLSRKEFRHLLHQPSVWLFSLRFCYRMTL